ncbi:MAG: hypothetical protein Kow0077_29370 [Anaerolineae bacterium]
MPNKRRRLVGRVVSDKMDKTVVVAVETSGQHRLYGKTITTTKKFLAHDESNAIPVGSTVRIVESRPLSKRKRWVVEEVLVQTTEVAAAAAASEAAAPEVSQAAAELLAEPEEAEAVPTETEAEVEVAEAEETAEEAPEEGSEE